MFDLAQIAHEWIAADMGRAMIAGAVLLGGAAYWVAGEEKWMSIEQIDAMLDEPDDLG